MTSKSTFKFHPLFYLIAFICFITGYFKYFIIFTSIILIHELGHITIGTIFKWKIEEVIILPFGGITIFRERLDKPLAQEFLIAIAGPLFQILFLLTFKSNAIFTNYNIAILIFNLLPIYPLDGSKIVNVILNCILPFKLSHIISIVISYIFILITFIVLGKYIFFNIVLLFIMLEIFKETSKHSYYFNKFLLERYLYPQDFKRTINIFKIEQMKKQTNHILKTNKISYFEREFINKIFDK